jgi:hypothetical protein
LNAGQSGFFNGTIKRWIPTTPIKKDIVRNASSLGDKLQLQP